MHTVKHIDWTVPSDATRVLLANCGIDPDLAHTAIIRAINQWFAKTITRDYVEDIMYLINMINSDYVPAMECIREGLLR